MKYTRMWLTTMIEKLPIGPPNSAPTSVSNCVALRSSALAAATAVDFLRMSGDVARMVQEDAGEDKDVPSEGDEEQKERV